MPCLETAPMDQCELLITEHHHSFYTIASATKSGHMQRSLGSHSLAGTLPLLCSIRFKDRLSLSANASKSHHIGLDDIDTGIWSIYLGRALLPRVDERDHIIRA